MKIQSQVYILQFIIVMILMVTLVASYFFYRNEYQQSLQKQIDAEISVQRSYLSHTLLKTQNDFFKKQKLFKEIHQDALKIYQHNKHITLEQLKRQLHHKYALGSTNIDIFLVNRTYHVYQSTLSQDVGLDLSRFPSAVTLIDKAFKTNEVLFADAISQDPIDLSYKLYSYAKVNQDTILEMSFFGESFDVKLFDIIQKATPDINVQVYSILQDNQTGGYFYYPLNGEIKKGNKQAFYDKIVGFDHKNKSQDVIARTFLTQKNVMTTEKGKDVIYVNVLDDKMVKTEYKNIIIRFEINTVQKERFQYKIKRNFVVLLCVTLLLLLLLNGWIKEQLLNPMRVVIKQIQAREQIPLEALNKRSEFYAISKEYNKSFLKLTNEVRVNKRMSEIDHLTQIGNRKAFETDLNALIYEYQENDIGFSILLFDVDDFKKINDDFGHVKGDEVLIDLCKQTVLAIRKTDYFFRTGGEEFVLLFNNTKLSEAKIVAQKIRENIEQYFKHIRPQSVTISGGLSEINKEDTLVSLYKRVDNLQYKAKALGKNQIQVSDDSVV